MANVRNRTSGAYIPPAKLRMMQQRIEDKNSEQYQRLAWKGLKKNINRLINKVNVRNIVQMAQELFEVNLIRGRGLFCAGLIRAQTSSATFTHVYAALVAVCNTKFPKVGELLIKRLIVQFLRTYKRNDKYMCINTLKFIAHLFNQQIVSEILPIQILLLLLNNPTSDSVEVAISFLKECGARLDQLEKRSIGAVFETLRTILQESVVDKRVQYMIEVIFVIRKDKFKDHPPVIPELDLVEEDDQITHDLDLIYYNTEDITNVFKKDDNFQANEAKYKAIKESILGQGDDDKDDDDDDDDDEEDDASEDDQEGQQGPTGANQNVIIDGTEANLTSLRKSIYLIIKSSLDFEECAHKLVKLQIKASQVPELCNMIVDCCSMERSYIKFYGLLAQRFCSLNQVYVESFKDIFINCYTNAHRLESAKLRNCAALFAHLLSTAAIPWNVLSIIKLNEQDTNSSNRVFVRYLFERLNEAMDYMSKAHRQNLRTEIAVWTHVQTENRCEDISSNQKSQ